MEYKFAKSILDELERLYPDAKTELENWKTDFQFLVCVVLSAQTTDAQVNKVTKSLFDKYTDPVSFANADYEEVASFISSINFYNTKAKHLIALSRCLVDNFDNEIPTKVDELIKLPGVGKKTANVFLNELFHANQGIAVDTHVSRFSRRLGLTNKENPDDIATELENIFPQSDWFKVNTRFVLFGRYVCKAREPLCHNCPFQNICVFYNS